MNSNHNCAYPIKKGKKFSSYSELLFERSVCQRIERGNTTLPYRDTTERLATLKSNVLYSSKIGKSGVSNFNRYWYYPKYR